MGIIYINPFVWDSNCTDKQDQARYIEYWKDLGWKIRISNEIEVSLWERISRRYPLYVTHDDSRKRHCVHVVYDNSVASQARLSEHGILEFVISDFKELAQVLSLCR